jgi:hypothetical protein
MALPALTPAWSLDGVAFNTGDNAAGFSYLVQNSEGWADGPPARPQLQDRPTSAGSYRSSNYDGSRVITLNGIAQAATMAQREVLADTLAGLCRDPDTLYPLVCTEFTRELVAYVERQGRVKVTKLPDGFTLAFNIQVVATNPQKLSTLVKSAGPVAISQAPTDGVLWEGTAGTSGAEWEGPAFPATGMVWQASSGTSGVLSMTNSGTSAASVLFTVNAPPAATLPQFSITEIGGAGRVITDSGTMAAGEVITINTATGYTTLNGSQVSGRFSSFNLITIPAKSTVSVQFASSGAAPGATLTASWQDTY